MANKFSLIPSQFFELPFRSFSHFPSLFENMEKGLPSLETNTGLTVSSDKKNVYIEADLPGISADDIDITLDNGILWIKGEKKEEQADKNKTFYRKSQNSFSYRVSLPEQVDENKEPAAEFTDGILKMTFTKSEKGKIKKINVKSKKKEKK